MLKSLKKWGILTVAGAILVSSLAGCSGSFSDSKPADLSTAGSSSVVSETGEFTYPIKTDKTLKIWSYELPHSDYTDYHDSPFHKGLSENTGVNLEWEFPVPGADKTQAYNIMLASGDLPDIIFNGLNGQELIDDKYIIPLNDVISRYAPNLSAYYAGHPELEKALKTDKGDYYMFPWLRESDLLRTYLGPVVRKDWLDEQKLDVPETIDDWTNTLTVFKEKYGATFAVSNAGNRMWQMGPWCAYGVIKDYYLDNGGNLAYGPALPGYKQALATMRQWYENGLIDLDFATLDDAAVKAKVLNNKTGLSLTASSQITSWGTDIAAGAGTGVWVAAPYPVLNEGDPIEFVQMDAMPTTAGAAITTACKDVELAARFLDWGYSEEGRLYWNFGAEGVSYNMVNGEPVLTDLVTKAPEGISLSITRYIGTAGSGFSIQDERMWRQKNSGAAVKAAELWASNNNMKKHALPTITPTTEESTELSSLRNSVNTYMEEMYYKFLFGEESLDNFDKYVETLNSLGLPRILEILGQQLDRYNNR